MEVFLITTRALINLIAFLLQQITIAVPCSGIGWIGLVMQWASVNCNFVYIKIMSVKNLI